MSPERDRRKRSRPTSVSVVVPAYYAAATLAELLEALAGQEYEDDWQVVRLAPSVGDLTGSAMRANDRSSTLKFTECVLTNSQVRQEQRDAVSSSGGLVNAQG